MDTAVAEPADDRLNAGQGANASSASPARAEGSEHTGPEEEQSEEYIVEEEEEEEMQQIIPRGSVYVFMVFVPPLSLKRYGHYWTKDVMIAFFLFFICTVLQLSLSILGGGQMVSQHQEAQLSLIQEVEDLPTYLSAVENWQPRGLDQPSEKVKDLQEKLEDLRKVSHKVSRDWQRQPEEQCCQGVECSGFGVHCCVPGEPGHSQPALVARPPQQLRRQQEDRPALRWGATGVSALLHWAFERKPGGAKAKGKKDGGPRESVTTPVCIDTHGILSCTSPSVAIVPVWGNLDVDGDGRWTYWEALVDAHNLGCHLGSPLVEIFRSACEGLIRDAKDTAALMNHSAPSSLDLPPEVLNKMAIPHAYFTWWQGLVGICQHGNPDLCQALLVRGTFDGTLAEQRSFLRGGIMNIHTALKYCHRLLRPGGICDDALPGVYAIYRSRMKEKCGGSVYSKGPHFKNPYQENDGMTLMSISFTHLDEVKYVHSASFKFFLWLILILWYINLMNEAQELVNLCDFLLDVKVVNRWPFVTPNMTNSLRMWTKTLPDAFQRGRDSVVSEVSPLMSSRRPSSTPRLTPRGVSLQIPEDIGYDKIHITEFARPHFYTCICIAAVRSVILVLIAYAGTTFLLSNKTLLDLLLNALALAFIFELDEFLFDYLLSEQTKGLVEIIAPLPYKSHLPVGTCITCMSERIVWGVLVIPVFAGLVVHIHNSYAVKPEIEALECLCLQTGPRCLFNVMFYTAWWDDYWSKMAALKLQ